MPHVRAVQNVPRADHAALCPSASEFAASANRSRIATDCGRKAFLFRSIKVVYGTSARRANAGRPISLALASMDSMARVISFMPTEIRNIV